MWAVSRLPVYPHHGQRRCGGKSCPSSLTADSEPWEAFVFSLSQCGGVSRPQINSSHINAKPSANSKQIRGSFSMNRQVPIART